ncbi:MAG TPA: prolyl oligopeptidase family serine peptidase, partial [Candidatus Hydrogenedentes bacterium]|nr:prolyl oligopeptidase family serine peptidase [Candidatus Hydrogenedentota bacterium]
LARRPIRAFHGQRDKTVPPAASTLMVNLVKKAGGDVELKIYPKLEHNSWDETYGDPEVIAWLLDQRLPKNEPVK